MRTAQQAGCVAARAPALQMHSMSKLSEAVTCFGGDEAKLWRTRIGWGMLRVAWLSEIREFDDGGWLWSCAYPQAGAAAEWA